MTRKDYVLLADAVFVARGASDTHEERAGVELVGKLLAAKLAADNPRFDRARFLKAAGVQS